MQMAGMNFQRSSTESLKML
ncbi:hypothetical protein [Robinsoniella sp. KNHs210]